MNRIKKTLFTAALLFILTACSTGRNTGTLDWEKLKNDGEGISLESSKIAKYSLSFDSNAFQKAMQNADEAAVQEKSIYTFSGEMNKVNNLFDSLKTKLNIARAKYYAYGTSSYKSTFNSLYEQYLSFYAWYYTFLQHVRDSSSDIYDAFFGDMSKREVNKYISEFLYTDETKNLDTEINDIQSEQEEAYNQFIADFRAKKITMGDSAWNQFLNDSIDRFRNLMSKGAEYASLYGFSNYLDYVYERW